MHARAFLVAAIWAATSLNCVQAADKTLVFCSEQSPDILNPQMSFRQATFDATSRQVYDRLLQYGPDSAEIMPALAESWSVSADGLQYEFRLRAGVRFHGNRRFAPTRALTAADVAFSFSRQLDPQHPYHQVSGGVYPYFRGLGLADILDSVTARDELTAVFRLKRPFPALPAILTLDFASILSAEYADAMLKAGRPELVDNEPLGTGPFRLIRYETDALITFEANKGYWRGPPPLDHLVFTIVPDAAARYHKLRDGGCHIAAAPDPADIPAMSLDSSIRLERKPGMDIGYLAFNTRKPPLNDARVRRALAMAIDRRAILAAMYRETGQAAATMMPAGPWSRDAAVQPPEADPQAAARLLEEAGVGVLELEIWPSPVSRPYMPDARRMAEMIRRDWQKIGVATRVANISGRDFIKKTMVGGHDVALFGWIAETMDRTMFLEPILGCQAAQTGANRSFWCDPHFDRLLAEASVAGTPAEADTLYELALAVLDQEVPVLPIASSIGVTPMRREVVNFHAMPLGGHYFYGVDLQLPDGPASTPGTRKTD